MTKEAPQCHSLYWLCNMHALVKGIRLMNYLCKASVPTSYLRSVYFLKVQEVLILISQLVREDFCRLLQSRITIRLSRESAAADIAASQMLPS